MRAAVGRGRLLRRPLGVLDNAFEQLLRVLGKETAGRVLLVEARGLGFCGYAALASFIRTQPLVYARMAGGQGLSGNPLITPECLAQLESNIVGTLSGAIIKAADLTVDGGLTLLGTVKILSHFTTTP